MMREPASVTIQDVYKRQCFNFINVIRQQESVKGFPGETLPSTAFYFSKQGITDWASLLSYGGTQEYATAGRTSEVLNRDRELSRYLAENTGQDLVACLVQREDSLICLLYTSKKIKLLRISCGDLSANR